MNPIFRYEVLTLALVSCFLFAIPSPLSNEPLASTEYLISRADVDAVLSKIIGLDEQIVLLSDFDGTLSDIHPNPNLTVIKPESKNALDELVTRPNVMIAIISGRPVSNLKTKIEIDNITYSGNHGMEMLFPNQTEWKYPITQEMYANCTKIKNILNAEYGPDIRGGWVEDKNSSLVYHYRNVPIEDLENVINEINEIVYKHGFKTFPAHGAIEIKPPVVWNKGHAALMIMEEFFDSDWETQNIRVLFMGDDTSDEDVMKMMKGKSTTFRITLDPNLETNADFRIQSTDTAVHILEWLVENTKP